MAIKPWKRFFGLQESRWAGRDPDHRPLPPDCETVITPPVLKEAGVKNPPRGLRALLDDSRFHYRYVTLPDGRKVRATHPTSLHWIVGVRRDEDRQRSLANLMVGDQARIETIVTKQQGSGGPAFEPEIWVVPITTPAPRPSAPLRQARPPAKPAGAVVRSDRELYSDIESHLRSEVLRILTAAKDPIGLTHIAAELHFQLSGEEGRALVVAMHSLRDEGAIIEGPGAGEGRLYRIAP